MTNATTPTAPADSLDGQHEHDHQHQHGGCGGGGCGACGSHGDAEGAPADGMIADEPTAGGCGGACGCGGHSARTPVLDARTIDPQIRQSAIFGVLVGMPPRGSVVVVSDVDPAPIAQLLQDRLPGEYAVDAEVLDDGSHVVTFRRH